MLAADMGHPSARMIRALLTAALECAGSAATADQVGRAISRDLATAAAIVRAAWVASMSDPKPKSAGATSDGAKLTWMRAWAIARQELGLSDDEWLDMTPRQFHSLEEVLIEQMQRQEWGVALIRAAIQNFSMYPPKKPAMLNDFMIHRLPDAPDIEAPVTGEYIMAQMANLKRR